MQNNLIAVRNGKIAFSTYFCKQNGFLTKYSLPTFIVHKETSGFHLNIPLRAEGLISTMNYKKEAKGYIADINVKPGAYMVSIGRHNATEYGYEDGEFTGLDIPVTPTDSFYVKSSEYGIESAATAASHIYTNVEDVYRAALNASINTYPTFLSGYISDIQDGIDKLNKLWDTKNKKQMIKMISELDNGSDDASAKFLGLMIHTE